MKRILSLILVISAIFLAGCDDRAKLEFDTVENVKNGVSKALSQSYDHHCQLTRSSKHLYS